MATKTKISVSVGQLTKPARKFKVTKGTTVGAFLEAQGIRFGAGVRVNLKATTLKSKLKANDLITITEAVSGGI